MKSVFAIAGAVMFAAASAFADGDEDFGGLLEIPGSRKGKAAFAVTTDEIPLSNVVASVKGLGQMLNEFNLVVEKTLPGTPEEIKKRLSANVVVIVQADDTTPTMLCSPDDHWAVVNVRALGRNLKTERAKARFLSGRCSKQIKRAFIASCGGINSSFPGNILSVVSVDQLDVCDDVLPVDRIAAAQKHMRLMGLTEREFAYYEDAVEEGWAPAPTNAVQKKIWTDIKAKQGKSPTNPIKIVPGQKPSGK